MGVRIRGILSVVPPNVRTTADLAARFGEEETGRIVATTGIREVRLASPGTTAADLAEEAAQRLLNKLNVEPRGVQGLIFISQTPDYIVPATACILQHRLGLGKNSLAFDVNLGCSAYPYGLAVVAALLRSGLAKRVLLLTADVPSSITHPDDKSTIPLFGDAAAATLLEIDDGTDDILGVDLGTDGSGSENLIIPVGRSRYPTTADFARSAPDKLRSIPYPEHVYMNGAEIFTFTLREVPGIIRRTLANAALEAGAVDYYFLHQANKFILDHLIRKMRLPPEKCPLSIDCFGNTSGVSPALTACHAAAGIGQTTPLVAMFVGFGVGYSWGGTLVRLQPGTLFPIEEQ